MRKGSNQINTIDGGIGALLAESVASQSHDVLVALRVS